MDQTSNRLLYKGDWRIDVRKDFIMNPAFSIGAKMLYLAIRSYCGPNADTAFPSSLTLSRGLKMSRDKVFKCANELEIAGLLERRQSHAGKRGAVNGENKPGVFSHTVYTLYPTESPKQSTKSIAPSVSCFHRNGETPQRKNTVTVKNGTNSLVPNREEVEPLRTIPTISENPISKAPTRCFSDGWCAAFKERFGSDYHYSGRDAKHAAELIKKGESPEELLATIQRAWSKTDATKYWKCINLASNVWDFAAHLSGIRMELSRDKSSHKTTEGEW
jgi:hypothetical protein